MLLYPIRILKGMSCFRVRQTARHPWPRSCLSLTTQRRQNQCHSHRIIRVRPVEAHRPRPRTLSNVVLPEDRSIARTVQVIMSVSFFFLSFFRLNPQLVFLVVVYVIFYSLQTTSDIYFVTIYELKLRTSKLDNSS